MPANWPDLTLAIALALVAAYLVADLAARAVRSMLRAIVPDDRGGRFVIGPGRVIHLVLFLIIADGALVSGALARRLSDQLRRATATS